jgi:hypothetical protein
MPSGHLVEARKYRTFGARNAARNRARRDGNGSKFTLIGVHPVGWTGGGPENRLTEPAFEEKAQG